MPNKNYTISIDSDLMADFQKKCRVEDVKYSVRIGELITADCSGESSAPDRIDLLLSKVMGTLNSIKEIQDNRVKPTVKDEGEF